MQSAYTMSQDEKIREAARMREKRLHDEASLLYGAREEGRAEGRAEGELKKIAEILSNMQAAGFSQEMINIALGRR